MKSKPTGWRREPARHALAAKGVETGISRSESTKLLLPRADALRPKGSMIKSELKVRAAEDLVAMALQEENQDEEAAIDLLKDPKWFERSVDEVVRGHAGEDSARAKQLRTELESAFVEFSKERQSAELE
jgi:hypothetical protein